MTAERFAAQDEPGIIEFVDPSTLDMTLDSCAEAERSALDSVNQHVAAGASLDAIMNYVFGATRDLFPCDRIGLAFLEDGESRVAAYWAHAQYEPLLLDRGYAEDLRGSSLEAVLRSGRIRIIHDLKQYLEFKPDSASTRLLVREGVRSSMTCPLRVEERPVGFLFRSSRRPSAYDRHQVLLQAALVERLGQAVEKAYRIEQLEASNQAYRELVAFVSHEVKNPVASIAMDARVLTGGYLGELTPDQTRKVENIVYKAEHVLQLARDYLDLSRVDTFSAEPHFRVTGDFVREVVDPAIEVGTGQLAEKCMRLIRALPAAVLQVTCEPELLRIALANLLSNAVKYGFENGEIRLTVERLNSGVRVTVWNEGPGFPEEERARLFRRFSRLQTPETRNIPGTGIGLYSVWRIAKVHGGVVQARSDEGKWAEFSLEFPQPPGDAHNEPSERLSPC